VDTLYPNTSLAATTLPNGDRRVYFQDAAGFIREAQYSISQGTWRASPSLVVAVEAMNGTSIAADSAKGDPNSNDFSQVSPAHRDNAVMQIPYLTNTNLADNNQRSIRET
jgi:hypothetical protein